MLVVLNGTQVLFNSVSANHTFILSVFHSYVSIFLDFSWHYDVLELYMVILFMYAMHIKCMHSKSMY